MSYQEDGDKLLVFLNSKMGSNDIGKNCTVRAYLAKLLCTLIEEEESFSGKRPFGNSGWFWGFYEPLVKSGLVAGEFLDGEVDGVDSLAAEKAIKKAILRGFGLDYT